MSIGCNKLRNEVGCAIGRVADLEGHSEWDCDATTLKGMLARLDWIAERLETAPYQRETSTCFNREAVSGEIRRRLVQLADHGDRTWRKWDEASWTQFFRCDDKTLCGIARHLRELGALLMIWSYHRSCGSEDMEVSY